MLSFAVLIPLQVLVFRNLVFFNIGFCFIYLLFLLSLPLELGIGTAMIIGLISGFIVDFFYHTIGIHAASGVMLMFLKPYWLRLNGHQDNQLPLIARYGLRSFLEYAGPLILVYCLSVFFIEAGNFDLFWITFFKALTTTALTLFFVVIPQYVFYRKKN